MNISYRWLKDMAPTIEGSPEEVATRLGMLGAPVDELIELGEGLGDVLIAKVEEVRQHPNADRLRICTVNAGGEALQVVCGAPNVEAGRFYPFAPIGASLPGGIEIKKAKLRGETSEGMLCSARELGLGKDHAGLMTLHGEWAPGTSFLEGTGLADARLVLDITPNRSDLLSHIGVARELAPAGAADVALPIFPGSAPTVGLDAVTASGSASADDLTVTVEDAADCPRYMAAVLEGVRIAASPEWLASRLRAIGLRPINNVVDATNYVLHELGQPLHAFDLDRLTGPEIRVRRARDGETIRTLDGVDRALSGNAIVIADRDRPVAIAGVMGGEDSEVGDGTTRILIECALFDSLRVRATAKGFGLSTDASHRYERGVDPTGMPRALERVIDLIRATAGGSVSGPVLDVQAEAYAEPIVELRPARVGRVLGVTLEPAEIGDLLAPIGFRVEGSGDTLKIHVPGFRPDVTREVDVIEEIARRRGYDSFAGGVGAYRPGVVPTDPLVVFQRDLRELLIRWGFLEARTAAFAPGSDQRVPILNPLSSEESHLRDDLAHGLVRRVEHNWAHGVRSIRLFEFGTVFQAIRSDLEGEEFRLAAIFTGPSAPTHWSSPSRPFDLWDLKALAAEIAPKLNATLQVPSGEGVDDVLLVTGESFVLVDAAGQAIGRAGRVSPKRLDAPAWAEPVWLLEARLDADAPHTRGRTFTPLPAFPAIERDVALLVRQGVSAASVEKVIQERGGALLEGLQAFDLYEGKGLPEGARSVAWRLRFRHPERTLTDREVDDVMGSILKSLQEELNVERR